MGQEKGQSSRLCFVRIDCSSYSNCPGRSRLYIDKDCATTALSEDPDDGRQKVARGDE